ADDVHALPNTREIGDDDGVHTALAARGSAEPDPDPGIAARLTLLGRQPKACSLARKGGAWSSCTRGSGRVLTARPPCRTWKGRRAARWSRSARAAVRSCPCRAPRS